MQRRLIDANELEDGFGCSDRDIYAKEYIREAPTVFEFPENPTNGDIIKAIFNISDSEIDEGLSTTYIYTKTRVLKGGSQDHLRERITFNREWWNAPYEKAGTQK